LGDRVNAQKINLKLQSKTLERQIGQGPKDRYPGIIHQSEQPLLPKHFVDGRCDLIHRVWIGHIKDKWNQAFAQFLPQSLRISCCADASKNPEPAPGQDLASSKPNSTGCAGNDYVWHRAGAPLLNVNYDARTASIEIYAWTRAARPVISSKFR
jgi:hypothetical protein